MPRLFCCFLAGLLAACGAQAQPAHVVRLFEEGNRHYAQEEYGRALQVYQKVAASGYASGALYYNMAGAYYRTGALGEAVCYYEKARQLLPENDQLRHSLETVRSHLSEEAAASVSLRPSFGAALWQRVTRRVGTGTLFVVGLVLYAVALLLWAHRLWTCTRRPWRRRTLAGALAGGLLLIALAFAAPALEALDRRAVVTAAEAPLRAAPAVTAASEQHLSEGFLLRVLEHRAGWTRVRLPDGTTGWLTAASLGEV